MKRLAVFINGLSAPIKDDYFLIEMLKRIGYEVQRIEPVIGQSIDEVKDKPDLIVGWSMGGLIAPVLAIKYPKSRLILVATGVKVNPSQRSVKMIFEMVGTEWGMKLLGMGLQLPKEILIDSYEQLNKVPVPEMRDKYRLQMEENVNLFRQIPDLTLKNIISYLRDVDNTKLLKKIQNKTLIFCGNKDNLMPVTEGRLMAELIKNSKLVVTGGGHYDVIGRWELSIIEEFLK